MKFSEFNLNEQLLEAIGYMGFKIATPIQSQAIPTVIEGKDLIACAQTGTGKTGAFLIPVLHQLEENPSEDIRALIITPTRELAKQIDQQIQGFAYFLSSSSITVYGGGDSSDWDTQKKALKSGTNIVVATPGKLLSHLNMGYVDFSNLTHLILDEADRMLDMGFYEDLQKIISYTPKIRQTLMFSATMAPKIRNLAKQTLKDPVEITLSIAKPAEGVMQAAYLTKNEQKAPLIAELIKDKPTFESIIIFSSTKKKVGDILRALRKADYTVASCSSNLEQKEREDVLRRFKSKEVRVLVATDVLSRGIDIKGINLVINYDVPSDTADYVHRIGRTARADSTGVALTLVNEDDMSKFKRIEDLIEMEVIKLKVPEHLGESPEWNPKFRSNKPRYNKGKRKHWRKKK